MNPVLTDLAINAGLVLVGALLRGHAPKVWPWIAPLFGTQKPTFLPILVQPSNQQVTPSSQVAAPIPPPLPADTPAVTPRIFNPENPA